MNLLELQVLVLVSRVPESAVGYSLLDWTANLPLDPRAPIAVDRLPFPERSGVRTASVERR